MGRRVNSAVAGRREWVREVGGWNRRWVKGIVADPFAVQADGSVAVSGDAWSAARLRCVGGRKFGGGDSCASIGGRYSCYVRHV